MRSTELERARARRADRARSPCRADRAAPPGAASRRPAATRRSRSPVAPTDEMRAAFAELHRRRFGYLEEDDARSSSMRWSWRRRTLAPRSSSIDRSRLQCRARSFVEGPGSDLRSDFDHRRRAGLARGARGRRYAGPHARGAARSRAKAIGTDVDPVRLEIFNNLFMAIAEEMGVALQSTATSVNIKERLDFSCAIFDAEGALIANAPHIPVHLGSMGESIRRIIDTRGAGQGRARDPARRCLCAERSLSRRHAPARHHRHRAGLLRRRSRAVRVRRRARASCRHRRHRARIDAARQPHASIRKAC